MLTEDGLCTIELQKNWSSSIAVGLPSGFEERGSIQQSGSFQFVSGLWISGETQMPNATGARGNGCTGM